MSINVNCCEGVNFQRVLCNCHWSARKTSNENKEQVVYTDRNEQIVILSTPHIELPELVLYDDIQNTDVAVFTLDSSNEVRFTALQGRNIFQSIDLQPQPKPKTPLAATASAASEVSDEALMNGRGATALVAEHKSHPSISNPEDVAGRSLKDILPEYMLKFLLPICKQTLQGNFLQLTIMWGGLTQLVRTYPVPDPKRRIVGGLLTISPFVSAFNVDVNRFSVGNIGDQPPTTTTSAATLAASAATTTTSSPAAALDHNGTPLAAKRTSKPEIMVMN